MYLLSMYVTHLEKKNHENTPLGGLLHTPSPYPLAFSPKNLLEIPLKKQLAYIQQDLGLLTFLMLLQIPHFPSNHIHDNVLLRRNRKTRNTIFLRSTVWKLRKFTLTLFSQKLRESNVFTKVVIIVLISQNIFL